MKNIKKLAAAAVSFVLAAASASCTPAIGGGTRNALTIDGVDVPAGMYIFYTLQAYNDAVSTLTGDDGTAPELKDVKTAHIDNIDAEDWIQNKAEEYCRAIISVEKEFDAMGGELTQEELDQAEQTAAYYYNQNSLYEENGVSIETVERIARNSYMEQEVFKHYYGFDSEFGCSEDELKDYFDDNFARVKYISISLNDDEGNSLDDDEIRNRRKKAEEYVKRINAKTGDMDKMWEMDKCSDEYNEYLESLKPETESEETDAAGTDSDSDISFNLDGLEESATTTAVEETTTTTTETTTTDPYANERLVQKTTTTEAADVQVGEVTTTAEESDSDKDSRNFSDYVFGKLKLNNAEIYEYNDSTIYVILRGDLRKRMTEDDYWSEDYITQIQQLRYYEDYVDLLEDKANSLSGERNQSAFRRYAPFKLVLEDKSATT